MGSEVRVPFSANARYPDPAVEVLDPSFASLRLYSASVEQLATDLRWAEGPVWFGDGRYLLLSDIPNNRIVRWDACSGASSICARDGSIWFTDPCFGILGFWEGEPATTELPQAFYRLDPATGTLQQHGADLTAPNGLAFSPDESVLYGIDSRAVPHRLIWAYDVGAGGALSNKRLAVDADGHGAFDGMAVDTLGNLWCGLGSTGAAGADPAALDGVRIYNPQGRAIGHIHLPERCANLCFGGQQGNRLFMAASHSLYALFVNVQGST
ncbi:MAG: SMP-30/gluconolactonase/LRE family protein [Rubrivivax sp.]